MSDDDYEKIKADALKLGFGSEDKPGISDYIRFLTRNVKIEVTIKQK